eukprot:9318362-Pyramimonas_sp.AAC.1
MSYNRTAGHGETSSEYWLAPMCSAEPLAPQSACAIVPVRELVPQTGSRYSAVLGSCAGVAAHRTVRESLHS